MYKHGGVRKRIQRSLPERRGKLDSWAIVSGVEVKEGERKSTKTADSKRARTAFSFPLRVPESFSSLSRFFNLRPGTNCGDCRFLTRTKLAISPLLPAIQPALLTIRRLSRLPTPPLTRSRSTLWKVQLWYPRILSLRLPVCWDNVYLLWW